ncbi:short chain dehydrogenase [Methylotenera mobilis]|uniref:Short-chain dehydrogenase/reductase SDR n=1 Tax=Methylotenera mobilis (strain JLW8 / ATCC BAA-1282 / DSM 17540) TaxID=583345 RepID=C6WXN2_METML|nr:short chain dehydrogenase [Methylotenera mobilis]ACT48681.1 short-chain dehydrogenase/reductase SDR [Methylotenera mobilis JLW8]
MKVLLVGASGTIGKAIIQEFAPRHEIIEAGKNHGQHQVDITNIDSVRALFSKVGKVDAIIAAAGNVHWGSFNEMTADEFRVGLNEKLMGQVNLTLVGQDFLNDGGSITLTSGSLSHDPYVGGAAFTTVNSAVDGFIRGVAVELSRDCRINSVSPNVLEESWAIYGGGVPGTTPVPAAKVALAYRKSVEGRQSGETYRVW